MTLERPVGAAVEETTKAVGGKYFVQKNLQVSPQLCQEILTGTLDDFSTSHRSKKLFREANGLSTHKGAKGWGHLDPLVTGGLPSPTNYQKLLRQVCHDECEDIVNEMLENIEKMTEDVGGDAMPSEQSCADRVVRKVEAEILREFPPRPCGQLGGMAGVAAPGPSLTRPRSLIGCSNAAPNIIFGAALLQPIKLLGPL